MRNIILIATLLSSTAAFADRGAPDFVGEPPPAVVNPGGILPASSGTQPIDPTEDVIFPSGSVHLQSAERVQVQTAAAWLKKHPNRNIVLEGHTDMAGPRAYNEGLATLRAQAVRDQLHRSGIAMDRIILVVYGETAADQRAVNPLDRRVVMTATPAQPQAIAHAYLDDGRALDVIWTKQGTLFQEWRGLIARR